jgi:putative membrane protein
VDYSGPVDYGGGVRDSGGLCEGFFAALWVALFLGIVNVLVKPVLVLITLPINILTLGLFTFVINAILNTPCLFRDKGFEVSGFWVAMFFSIVVSLSITPSTIFSATK